MTQWILVTGVVGGIGRAVATAASAAGYSVIGIDRADATSEHCDIYRAFDLRDWHGLADVVTEVSQGLDVVGLVNNAAHQAIMTVTDLSDADIEATLGVNVAAAAVAIRSLAPSLARSGGSVVNISSVHAIATSPGMSLYASSKAALLGLTRGASLDLAESGVRVNAVVPGAIDSGLLHQNFEHRGVDMESGISSAARAIPLGRVGRADEVAEAVLFLLDGARSGFITGQQIVIDGGASARLASE